MNAGLAQLNFSRKRLIITLTTVVIKQIILKPLKYHCTSVTGRPGLDFRCSTAQAPSSPTSTPRPTRCTARRVWPSPLTDTWLSPTRATTASRFTDTYSERRRHSLGLLLWLHALLPDRQRAALCLLTFQPPASWFHLHPFLLSRLELLLAVICKAKCDRNSKMVLVIPLLTLQF